MRPEAEPWWQQVQADLAVARQLVQSSSYFASAWFAHQAVEKGLKALFFEQYRRPAAYTHDLLYLGSILALPTQQMTHIQVIDPAFKFARYPNTITLVAPVDGVSQPTASRLLQAAEEIMTWLEAQLP